MAELKIRLSVEVSDKSFEAHLDVPVSAGAEYLDRAAKMWMNALREALELQKGKETS